MKISLSKEKSCVRVVVDYADTRFSNFVIEYLSKSKKNFSKPFLPALMGPSSNILTVKSKIS